MDTGLKGKTVLITGASRNMGRFAALAFAREGANLALCTSRKMKELGAVAEEARALGASDGRIITQHILPNCIFPVLVVASLDIGTVVQSFAALAFFGLGVPNGYADWGQMIATARNAIPTIGRDWYLVVYPGTALVLFSLAWNLIGDTVRDIMDPRQSGDG